MKRRAEPTPRVKDAQARGDNVSPSSGKVAPADADDVAPSSASNAAWLHAFATHLEGRAENTREAYLRDAGVLAAFAGATDLSQLAAPRLRRFLAILHGRGLSGRSLSRMLSSWRAFYRFLQDHDPSVKENPCAGLKAPKSPKRLPAALSPDEAVHLVSMPAEDLASIRDRALFELAYSSGLRLSELAGVDLDRIDLDEGEVRVMGKGSKERVVPVGSAAREAIAAWLDVRAAIPHADAAALFIGTNGKRVHPRTIERRLASWAIKRGIPRHVHPHMLRHSFASHVLQSSGDLRAVQEMLGHASIASTQIYTHLDFQHLAAVYDKAHPRAKKRR